MARRRDDIDSGARGLPGLGLIAVAVVATASCNAIFGISSPEARSSQTASGTTGTGAGTASSSNSSSGEGGGGHGGGAGGPSGSSTTSTGGAGGMASSSTGMAGMGGMGGCSVYAGDATITATNAGDADIATVMFTAPMSVSGAYQTGADACEFSIGGAAAGPLCDIGFFLSLAGNIAVGDVFTFVSRTVFEDPVAFHAAKNAFIELNANLHCMPPAPEQFDSFDMAMGQVKVESIVGTSVSLSVTGAEVKGVMGMVGTGKGTLVLDGTARADCFFF